VDGRYFCDKGNACVDNGNNNVLELHDEGGKRCVIRRGFQASYYEATYKFTWSTSNKPGWVVRWRDPGNWLAIALNPPSGMGGPQLVLRRRKDDGTVTTLAGGSGSGNLTAGNTYEAKVVVDEDPNNPGTQRLRFYVDDEGNGFGDDSAVLTDTTYIDQDWSVGMVGLYGGSSSGDAQEFDDVQVWIDNTGGQTMDDQQIDDDFDSNVLALAYDHNGNLTDDGIHKYVYDAWDRLVEVTRRVDDEDTVAEYEYDGLDRRIEKVVSNSGEGVVPGSDDDGTGIQAGDRHERYYYAGWRMLETRDDSDRTLGQWVWGTQYIDELVCYDRNMDADSDCLEADDERYYYHQDANWRVVMLTDEFGGVVERYDYTAYGEPQIFAGVSSNSEYGDSLLVSSVGNPFMHQGLFLDPETRTYQNRFRQYDPTLGRFLQRDPLGYWDGMNLYEYLGNNPLAWLDPLGLCQEDFGEDLEDLLWALLHAHPELLALLEAMPPEAWDSFEDLLAAFLDWLASRPQENVESSIAGNTAGWPPQPYVYVVVMGQPGNSALNYAVARAGDEGATLIYGAEEDKLRQLVESPNTGKLVIVAHGSPLFNAPWGGKKKGKFGPGWATRWWDDDHANISYHDVHGKVNGIAPVQVRHWSKGPNLQSVVIYSCYQGTPKRLNAWQQAFGSGVHVEANPGPARPRVSLIPYWLFGP
jgi:RHS repeat-associated protein